jgi:hypothetical protein
LKKKFLTNFHHCLIQEGIKWLAVEVRQKKKVLVSFTGRKSGYNLHAFRVLNTVSLGGIA